MMSRMKVAAAVILAAGTVATAQSLTNGFGPPGFTTSQTDPNGGIMFDVTALNPAGLLVTSLDIHSRATAGTSIDVEVYYKPGTHVGSEGQNGAWTLLSAQTLTAAGLWTPTPIAFSNGLVIPANETYAIYINIVTNEGAVVYWGTGDIPPDPSNADMQLHAGNARAINGKFLTGGFFPRGWQGTIYYSDCATANCSASMTGACCVYAGGCTIDTEANCRAVHNGFYQGDSTTCASCVTTAEVEPNNTKLEAQDVVLAHGEGITGVSTASTGTATPGSPDYFRIQMAPAPLGIYRHRMVLGNSTAGNSSWVRGLTQTAATAGPWAGAVGTATATESTAQAHQLEGPNRVNYWYGFGRGEQVYYRVSGVASSTGQYTAILETTPVEPIELGTFQAGAITIDTIEQFNIFDTALRIWDADLNPIHGYSNDDASTNGGAPANSSNTSFLLREFGAGTYYLGITIGNLATDQGSPSDDNFRTGPMLDFPNAAANTGTATTSDVSFRITDSMGALNFPAQRGVRHGIAWFRFTVTGTIDTGACCFYSGTCAELTAYNCLQQGGAYQGDGSDCTTNPCPQPGACCVPSGCVVLHESECLVVGGDFRGGGTTCATGNCPPATVANIIGFNFRTNVATPPDPQNWNRISAPAAGSLSNVMDDTGAPTTVGIEWGGTGNFLYIAPSTLAPDAAPQHIYDLSGMNGYAFRSSEPMTITLSGLNPSTQYEYWFVAHRSTSEINQIVQVSSGDVMNAINFPQSLPSASNNGRFVVNEVNANSTMLWDNLSLSTESSSTGTITFNWERTGTAATVIGALAIRQVLSPPTCYANCDESTIIPILNVDDFTCFINEFAAAQPLPHAQQVVHYANCDGSTIVPALNVDDFTCFINAFAAGCP